MNAEVCRTCGACCAAWKVGFPARETTARGGPVPVGLTEPWIPGHVRMRGTTGREPRCAAFEGRIGERAACTIHGRHPSPCRAMQPSTPDRPNPFCDEARLAHGMAPLVARPAVEPSEPVEREVGPAEPIREPVMPIVAEPVLTRPEPPPGPTPVVAEPAAAEADPEPVAAEPVAADPGPPVAEAVAADPGPPVAEPVASADPERAEPASVEADRERVVAESAAAPGGEPVAAVEVDVSVGAPEPTLLEPAQAEARVPGPEPTAG